MFEMTDTFTISTVTVRTGDLSGMTQFYREIIGLETVTEQDGRTVVGVDGEALLVLVEDKEALERETDEAGLYHVAFQLPDRAALGTMLARLEDADITLGGADHGVSEALYLEDPDGNGIEIYRDRPRAEWREEEDRVVMVNTVLDREAVRNAAGDEPVPAGTGIGHVHLEVSDLQPAEQFYADTLGFTVRARWGDAVFLAADDYHHHVGLNTWQHRIRPRKTGAQGLAAVTCTGVDVGALADHLEETGTRFRDMANGVAIRDPDNIEWRFLRR